MKIEDLKSFLYGAAHAVRYLPRGDSLQGGKPADGPWSVAVTDEGYEVIADSYAGAPTIAKLEGLAPQVKASARLMAAAPDMLAVLRELYKGMLPGTDIFYWRVDKAIKKAEGRK